MRLVHGFASFAGWVGMVLLCSGVALPGCSSKHNSDDDDDSGSSGQAGAGDVGASCDSTHKCGSALSCVSGVCVPSGTGGTSSIPPGELGSQCDGTHACNADLRCYSGICIPDTVGTGGTSSTEEGTLGGSCYPNDTCNAGLSCFSGYCLPETSLGGSSGSGGSGGGSKGGSGGTLSGGSGGSSNGGSGGNLGGTGGSSNGGSGGSLGGTGGSKGGSGGSGGTGGGGTGGGGTGGTPSTKIIAEDGWVAEGSNSVGIVGSWSAFVDTYSEINSLPGGVDFTGAGSDICVSGIISQSDEYGPTISLNLNQPDPAGDALGYIPLDHNVTGFSWGLSGSALPSTIQVTYATPDETYYCAFLTAATSGSLQISGTRLSCWDSGGAVGATSTAYSALQFQLPVNYHADGQTFDFCITNLTALTN